MPLDEIISIVIARHSANDPATPDQLQEFEKRAGYVLPDDMRRFYLNCNGAALFESDTSEPLVLLRVDEFERARIAIFGDDDDTRGSPSCYVFCDRGDGDYFGIDLSASDTTLMNRPVYDIWHEAYPDMEYCGIVAWSFHEFLEIVLSCNPEDGFILPTLNS